MSPSCPSFESLSRLASGDRESESAAHVAGCTRCASTLESLRALGAATRQLEEPEASPGWPERVEREILALSRPARSALARSLVSHGAAIAAAAAVAVVATRLLWPQHAALAQIDATPGTRLQHIFVFPRVAGDPWIERVELEDGLVSLDVERLDPGERLVVTTRDAEVEVRGTRFQVAAHEGRLRRVSVQEGVVEVRLEGAPEATLRGGESWEAPQPPGPAAPPAPPVPAISARRIARSAPVAAAPGSAAPPEEAPPDAPRPPPRDPPPASSPAERAFTEGWDALSKGQPGRAADRFALAGETAGDEGLREDADYWRIVALQRLGEAASSEREARRFLDRFPASVRAGELALLVGAGRLAAGDLAAARRFFERAHADDSPGVREQASRALEAMRPGAADRPTGR